MRKLDPSLENPIDNIFIDLADNTDGIYRKLNMTPNNITTLSLFFGIMTAYYIYKGYNKLATLTYIISYYYDCMDGNFARKYNMVTDFGDCYDHISDWFKMGLILFAMYKRNSKKLFKILPIVIILIILSTIHLGCQEKITHINYKQPILDNAEIFCPDSCMIEHTKWFGVGTTTLIMSIIIYTF